MIDLSAIRNADILIVDDQDENVTLLERVLGSAGYTAVTSTVDPFAVCALHRSHRYDLILLDLLMPRMDGFQVMEELKTIEPEGYLPVLVLTAQPDHNLRALEAGAKDFVSKPFDLAELLLRVHNMLEVRLLHKELHQSNELLEQRVLERTAALKESYLETIFTMTRAAEHKDVDLGSHVQRISHYSRALAVQLGLDKEFVDLIFFASPMHDIGKIGIPDQVLLKPGALTPDEWEIMKRHTTMGAQILGQGTSPYLKMGAEIARSHHERWDGGGYPHGTRGEAIPLAARIMNICDIYDALRSKRPYKPAFDHHLACDIIIRGDARIQPEHFDPVILAAFTQYQQVFRDIFEECTA
ncbi:HD domain-containing phosphohydrolase [uncultured Thiodictyon sp.]|jgi:putative two-component system response regulator|uniref:HD domain-containing phosphohydrolase n=1 Tax=uncultured Thiodictyon sp. TaxID=1846217 RepID=UPI0025DD2E23|nr:HD domain-containing phosphohydrolase [uncultured Thiodictyon sp.]